LKLLNSIREEVADILKLSHFFLETYTLPKNYIELENTLTKANPAGNKQNKASNWVVNKGNGRVIEVIPGSSKDTLLDFYHYKKHFPCRVTRALQKPFYFDKRLLDKTLYGS